LDAGRLTHGPLDKIRVCAHAPWNSSVVDLAKERRNSHALGITVLGVFFDPLDTRLRNIQA